MVVGSIKRRVRRSDRVVENDSRANVGKRKFRGGITFRSMALFSLEAIFSLDPWLLSRNSCQIIDRAFSTYGGSLQKCRGQRLWSFQNFVISDFKAKPHYRESIIMNKNLVQNFPTRRTVSSVNITK